MRAYSFAVMVLGIFATAAFADPKAAVAELKEADKKAAEEIERLKAEREALQLAYNAQVAKLQQERDVLMKDREAAQREIERLTRELRATQERYDRIVKDFADMQSQRESPKLAIRSTAFAAAFGASSVLMPAGALPNNLRGRIIAVGRNGMIELAIGTDDGLTVGHTLDAYRTNSRSGAQYLGQVSIIRTERTRALAQWSPPQGVVCEVQIGDEVAPPVDR